MKCDWQCCGGRGLGAHFTFPFTSMCLRFVPMLSSSWTPGHLTANQRAGFSLAVRYPCLCLTWCRWAPPGRCRRLCTWLRSWPETLEQPSSEGGGTSSCPSSDRRSALRGSAGPAGEAENKHLCLIFQQRENTDFTESFYSRGLPLKAGVKRTLLGSALEFCGFSVQSMSWNDEIWTDLFIWSYEYDPI